MRAVLLALLVVLACTVSVVSASSEWSTPSWSSDYTSSELEARHAEFLMAVDASSSTGAPAPSSTGATRPRPPVTEKVPVVAKMDCTVAEGPRHCNVTAQTYADMIKNLYHFPDEKHPGETLTVTLEDKEIDVDDDASTGSPAATSTGARRLLSTKKIVAVLTILFTGSTADAGASELVIYNVVAKSLSCSADSSKSADEKTACVDAVAAEWGVPSLSADPTFVALAAQVIPGTVESESAITSVPPPTGNNVQTSGGPRRTNGGFYFLGALVLLFAIIALVYFIVHKKPVNTLIKEELPRRDEVAMASVVAAPGSGVVVAEDAPLSGQQQMDYRSVFALKHNVLDKSAEQKAAEDEHNHNDVHFILHQ